MIITFCQKKIDLYFALSIICCVLGIIMGWVFIRILLCSILGVVFSSGAIAFSFLTTKDLQKQHKGTHKWTIALGTITFIFSFVFVIFSIIA